MKRFLAFLLTAAMLTTVFSGIIVFADAEATVVYVDNDMENRTSDIPSGTYVDDEILDTVAVKYSMTPETERVRTRMGQNSLALRDTKVLWTEYSIKYEGAFTRFNLEHDQASPALWIDDAGSLWTGGYNIFKRDGAEEGSPIGYTLELGKWYHLAVALDYTKGDAGAVTIWVNGEKIINGHAAYSRLQGGKGFIYTDFSLSAPLFTNSDVYIDNVRIYSTNEIDSHPENVALQDADSTDAIGLTAGYITGAENATVADVKAAFVGSDGLTFVKDGVVAADDAMVSETDIYATLGNGKGFRTLKLATKDTQLITKKYADISFDNWTNTTHGITVDNNKVIPDNMWMGGTATLELSEIPERTGKSLSTPVATESSTPYYVRARVNAGIPSNYSNCEVLWTEFSVKYEGGLVGFGFGENDSAFNLVSINKSGNIEIGTRWGYGEVGGTNFSRGTVLANQPLEVGKWYHIAAAIDFTDAAAAESGAPFYIWLNGVKVSDGVRSPYVKPGSAWVYHKLWIDTAEAEGASVYVDNLKIYETAELDTHAVTDFDIKVEDANADDDIYFEDTILVAPEAATVADIKAAIRADNYLFMKDGVVLSDGDMANGALMTIKADNAIGMKQYRIQKGGMPVDILGAHATGISASIATSNAAHPVTGMINDGMSTDADLYKSNCTDSETPLVVTIPLDAYYLISSMKIYERNLGGQRNVTIDLGKNGIYNTVATAFNLNAPTTGQLGITEISFNETEADTIRLTFTGTPADGQQTYQIWEIEAYAVKAGNIPEQEKISGPVGDSAITSITTNIPTRAGAHPVRGMIDGNREYSSSFGGTDDSLYKSSHDYDAGPLKVLLTLDGVYTVSSLKIFERRIGQNPVTVSVLAGKDGEFTEIASDVSLVAGAYTGVALETPISVPWTDADAVMLVFENAGDYDGAESSYQISEIEVYGEKADDVTNTGIVCAYCYWEETNNSIVIAYANGTQEDITADTFIAAYEGNKMVALCKAREMTIPAGSVIAQYSMSVAGIKQDGRTYKAFVMDSVAGLKPLMKVEIVG